MCGICGQLRFDNQAVKSQDLEIMRQKIARRGPDDSGIWLNKNIGFGHQRLSIIDLSNHAPSRRSLDKLPRNFHFDKRRGCFQKHQKIMCYFIIR
jgi:asparagine synthetase B (glutamine-hydrolysing)